MAKPADFYDSRCAHPKGKPRKKVKAKRDRTESKILQMVRMHNVARDGYCRAAQEGIIYPVGTLFSSRDICEGPSELAHLERQRRFKTRGIKPELRHTTAGTAMLCQKHHRLYDARQLCVELRSNAGADGELRWYLL